MNQRPTIMLCPAGTAAAASSRLRCIVLARELERLGCRITLGFDARVLPQVLYVQKVSSPEIVEHARRVRAEGGHVVFDIDDWGDAVPWLAAQPQLLVDLLAHCSAVSVDTTVRAEVLAKESNYRDVPAFWVVPDPIDYVDQMIDIPARAPADGSRALSACWFGNGPNLPPALPYIQAALMSGSLERFTVITNSQFVASMQQSWPMLAIEAWELETFPRRLREHDFCLLVHNTDIEGLQKSNNKMLAALAQGVVPLVSNTPAYAETARLIGLPELVIDSPQDLQARLTGRQVQALRERVTSHECQATLSPFMPAAVAQGFLARIEGLMASNARPPAEKVQPVRINLGCGDMPLPGYINVDVATERRGLQPDVCCDIRDLSVFPGDHADEVMAIHVIEHFYRWEVVDLIKEWVRVLKPGGLLVLECPNLLAACEALLKDPDLASRPDQAGSRTMWCFYGDPSWKDPLMCHRWLYTPQSLAQVMHEAGLRQLSQEVPQFKARHPRDMRIVGVKPTL
jgi:predicted SAM-dependent methyltransferase